MAEQTKRLIGIRFDDKPIYAPKPSHSLLLATAGSRKTTCGAVPWLLSLMADKPRAIIINDCKDGEIAAQCADLCHAYGRNVVILDDFCVLGKDNPYRLSLTPFGNVLAAHEKKDGELIFSSENTNHALIAEPPNDARNQYWRDEPRTLIEFALLALLKRNVRLATPGDVWALVSNPRTLLDAAKIEAEESDEILSALALHILDMRENNKEHFGQHRGAALKALRIYSAGSQLHHSGVDSDTNHFDLIKDKCVVFIVGPQRHMARLGTHYALQLQSFMKRC